MKKGIILIALVLIAVLTSVSVTQAATLKVGSAGTEIRMIQSELQTLNYNVGPIDGIFGDKTKTAVLAFQRDQNLIVDGIVGPQTLAALKKAYNLNVESTTIEIRKLQSKLQALNYDVGPIDGIFGTKTKTAVQTFQRDKNLVADGIVGPQTLAALDKAFNSPQETTKQIINTAKSFLGVPYKWGGTTPAGFDCSGFTQYVFASQNITLPRVSIDQYAVGTSVAFSNLIPGDLVFFNLTSGTQISHVGIYIGDNQFISATTSKGVAIYGFTPYWSNAYVGAKRVY